MVTSRFAFSFNYLGQCLSLPRFAQVKRSPPSCMGSLDKRTKPKDIPSTIMEFVRLQRSEHFRASHLCRMYGRPGRKDIRPATCLSCQHLELKWNWYPEDIYFCSKCRDLDKQESHRNAFLKLLYHLTNTLPPPFLLPCLFDYLYPEAMRHKHTRTQQRRTLKIFLLGFPGTKNSFSNLHVIFGMVKPIINKTGIT